MLKAYLNELNQTDSQEETNLALYASDSSLIGNNQKLGQNLNPDKSNILGRSEIDPSIS